MLATRCAIRRVVVVLPLVPVTAMIGMRAVLPGGNSMSTTGAATLRGRPSVGAMCMRKPGAAFTSITAPRLSLSGTAISVAIKSMPQMSRPTMPATRSASSTL